MSTVDNTELQILNQEVKAHGNVDREHMLKFLTLIPTNDGKTIVQEVQDWLQALHDDPTYGSVVFPQGDINAILGDLDSYGRVSTATIQKFKENSNKVVP